MEIGLARVSADDGNAVRVLALKSDLGEVNRLRNCVNSIVRLMCARMMKS